MAEAEAMTTYGVTSRQRDLLAFIRSRIESDGVAPSFDEMCVHVGVSSKSGIHRMLSALEERGLIVRLPNRARAIALTGRIAGTLSPAETLSVRLSPDLSLAIRTEARRRDMAPADLVAKAISEWTERERVS